MNETLIKAIAYQEMTKAIKEEYGKAAVIRPLLNSAVMPLDIEIKTVDKYTFTAETDFIITFANYTTMMITAIASLDTITGVTGVRLKTYL